MVRDVERIRPEQAFPGAAGRGICRPVSSFPVLNIEQFLRHADARFVTDLAHAFRTTGFVALTGHGIEAATIDAAYRASREFFALPTERKRHYHQPGGGGARGYTPFGVENAKDCDIPDLKEFWHVGREDMQGASMVYPPNVWCSEVAGFRDALLTLYEALDQLGARVLAGIALGLELPESYFADKVQWGNSILRALHYPPVPAIAGGAVRAAAHEDINLITLLVGSREPGLEIRLATGQWVAAPTGEDLIICNIGDMMQRLTNRVLVSTTHRVVNPPAPDCEHSRYSIPFFLHPNGDFLIQTLQTCLPPGAENHYPEPILADDYLMERLREIGLIA